MTVISAGYLVSSASIVERLFANTPATRPRLINIVKINDLMIDLATLISRLLLILRTLFPSRAATAMILGLFIFFMFAIIIRPLTSVKQMSYFSVKSHQKRGSHRSFLTKSNKNLAYHSNYVTKLLYLLLPVASPLFFFFPHTLLSQPC